MKGISLWQPWAELMASGLKRNETRSWQTEYRGTVCIYAAKKWDSEIQLYCAGEPYKSLLEKCGVPYPRSLSFGGIVAVGELTQIMTSEGWMRRNRDQITGGKLLATEYKLGNYNPGRFVWKFERIRRLPEIIPASARQGLFTVQRELAERALRECVPHTGPADDRTDFPPLLL